ncbi:sigma-54-dependent Fis family transcriptional regulator [candidate division KSB1 bacterium]|nr:sigma-54-dependent Fis family transcriptional regulator [candidate division KSB1 bacterium]
MPAYIEQIFHEKKIAYAIFDQDLLLAECSHNFTRIIQNVSTGSRISAWEIFPELVGSEDRVNAVLSGNKKRFQLEKISKLTTDKAPFYYEIILLPVREKVYGAKRLLIIVTDTTAETSLEQAIRQQKYEIELLQASLSGYGHYLTGDILGESPKIKKVREFIGKIAHIPNTTVLLQGESGTGKNLVARAIHQTSMSPKAPFIEINCASIPATLLESEIFGYEKGAFTNAIFSKKGLLEEADGGTLFLDEIGELPLPLQAKFLSFLETKRFRRLGSTQEKSVDVRIISATNKELKEAVNENEFRPDLFFRLNVVTLNLPPLRELENDIMIIAQKFINLFAYDFRKQVKGLTDKAKAKLITYTWPGNVRELRNVIERAVIFAEGKKIDAADLLLTEEKTTDMLETRFEVPEKGISLAEVEKKLLFDALSKAGGNQSRAARLLNLSLDTFRYRIKKYDIARND